MFTKELFKRFQKITNLLFNRFIGKTKKISSYEFFQRKELMAKNVTVENNFSIFFFIN